MNGTLRTQAISIWKQTLPLLNMKKTHSGKVCILVSVNIQGQITKLFSSDLHFIVVWVLSIIQTNHMLDASDILNQILQVRITVKYCFHFKLNTDLVYFLVKHTIFIEK